MAGNKTVENNNSVTAYINSIKNDKRKKDVTDIVHLFEDASGYPAKMWGTAIIGFGSYHYKYESGREGDMPLAGLSSRANAITLYLSIDPLKRESILKKLGKHKSGKGCIYIDKLEDIESSQLKKMVVDSVKKSR